MGDFDGDGRDELVIRSTTGLTIVEVQATGAWSVRLTRVWGTSLGGHVLSASDTYLVGDIQNDGRDELFMAAVSGATPGRITIIQNLGLVFGALTQWNPGTPVGGWNHGTVDRLRFVADFDGDGAADFMISSPWGFGTFKWTGSALQMQQAVPFGYSLPTLSADPNWVPAVADAFLGVADVDGDGGADLITRSTTRFGVISLISNVLRTRTSKPLSYLAAGGWRLGGNDFLLAALDTDAVAGDELIFLSVWGMGIITFSGGGTVPRALRASPHNNVWNGWLLRGPDRVYAVGDANNEGTEEFLFQRR